MHILRVLCICLTNDTHWLQGWLRQKRMKGIHLNAVSRQQVSSHQPAHLSSPEPEVNNGGGNAGNFNVQSKERRSCLISPRHRWFYSFSVILSWLGINIEVMVYRWWISNRHDIAQRRYSALWTILFYACRRLWPRRSSKGVTPNFEQFFRLVSVKHHLFLVI